MTAEMLSELQERTTTLADSHLASVQAVVEELESAWNSADGARFARPFTEDADFVNLHGLHARGRTAIAEGHNAIFRTIYAGSHITYTLGNLRMLGDCGGVALLRARLQVPRAARAIEARPLMVLARRRGRWQIAAFQNTLVANPADGRPAGT